LFIPIRVGTKTLVHSDLTAVTFSKYREYNSKLVAVWFSTEVLLTIISINLIINFKYYSHTIVNSKIRTQRLIYINQEFFNKYLLESEKLIYKSVQKCTYLQMTYLVAILRDG
jgi:hypothetical protein